jgi:replicative DNA helicase
MSELMEKFEFDADFQTKIVACVYKDPNFNRRALELIKPEYFDSEVEASIIDVVGRYFKKYNTTPSFAVASHLVVAENKAKTIRKETALSMIEHMKDVLSVEPITDAEFIAEQVSEFARRKAMESAALASVELIESGEYEKAAKVFAEASQVGLNDGDTGYDFFGEEEIAQREMLRNERLAGVKTKRIIPSGIPALDKRLFHKGFGRGEYYSLMGPPKSGKSISLAFFAKNAVVAGYNVLMVTLEVSKAITAERIDSSLTGIAMMELENNIIAAKEKIEEYKKGGKMGRLIIEERPHSTLTVPELSRIIQNHKSKGIIFDMIVVDYADIMRPEHRYNDPIENSKSIYSSLRAMAQIEDVVLLSATQTNREGAKVVTAKMEHQSEDFNRIRIPDLVISINATEDEKARGEARLYFVASRNQQDGFSIHISQDLSTMTFIKSVLKIE